MVNREEYLEKLKQQLDQWNTELAKWETKTREAQSGMRTEYEKQLTAYRSKRDQAIEELSKVQSASGEAWRELARGADEAWARMSEAFEKASSYFRK
jgi:lipid II:glycine glycyltransferase (peptidoglycan interpeptide bridge formation enzyme)